jgi:hypothetical protein
MKSITLTRAALAALAASLALAAGAQTLYKLIDKNGKVTYSEEKPKNFDGQVIRIDIDPNANTATLPKPAPKASAGEGTKGTTRGESASPRKSDGEARVAQAQSRLDEAKRAFQDLRDNPGPEDMRWIGVASGGTRQVPTEDYARRLEQAEKAVRDAEEELRRAERER